MQMRLARSQRNLWLVLLTFLFAGTIGGLSFGWLITRPSLQSFWFTREGMWVFPKMKFHFVAGGLFFLAIFGASTISIWKGWFHYESTPLRLIGAIVVYVTIPVCIALANLTPAPSEFVLVRIIVGLMLSLALFVFTKRWHNLLAVLIVSSQFFALVVASIPDLFVASLPYVWFESLEVLIGMALLGIWSGCWFWKSSKQIANNASNAKQ